MAAAHLSAARLREVLSYDPETGLFRWLVTRNKAPAGKVAGCLNKSIGYVVIRVDANLHYAHRLAFLFMDGKWPSQAVDHIDGNRSNNCWANLRDVAQVLNTQNIRTARGHSTSQVLGACKTKTPGQWRGIITVDGKQKHLGTFTDPLDAGQAYLKAKRKLHKGNTL